MDAMFDGYSYAGWPNCTKDTFPGNTGSWAEHYGYNPNPNLPGTYTGVYPVACLQRARASLIDSLKYDKSDLLERVKPKIGIGSSYGPPLAPGPPGPPGPWETIPPSTVSSLSASHTEPSAFSKTEGPTTVGGTSAASGLYSRTSTTKPSTSTGPLNAPKRPGDPSAADVIKQLDGSKGSAIGTVLTSASSNQPQNVINKLGKTIKSTLSTSSQRQNQNVPLSGEKTVKTGLLPTPGQSQNAPSFTSDGMGNFGSVSTSNQSRNAPSSTSSASMVNPTSVLLSDHSRNAPRPTFSMGKRTVTSSSVSSNPQKTHSVVTSSQVLPNMVGTAVNSSFSSTLQTSFRSQQESEANSPGYWSGVTTTTHQLSESNLVSIPLIDPDNKKQSGTYMYRDGNDLWHMKRKLPMENSEDSTPGKRVKSETDLQCTPTSTEVMQELYKCDFCSYKSGTPTGMEFHLKQAKHFSASLYNTRGSEIVSVKRKLAVKNKHGKNQALAVVCPDCKDLFEDIFMCALHYRVMHEYEPTNGCYSICPVIHQETLFMNVAAICKACSESFINHRQLNKHWEKYTDHHPVQKGLLQDKAFALYSCVYCDKSYYGNFLACKAHVLNHKRRGSLNGPICSIKLQHIMLPLRAEQIPPYPEKSSKEFYQDELATLKNMKKHLHGMGGTKKKIKLVEERIMCVKKFITANSGYAN